jgi:hypothetical protein
MDVDEGKPSAEKEKIKKNLREQIEFYFSDENLLNDKFLKKYMLSDNVIDVSLILKFNKIRSILSGYSEDQMIKAIKSCLKNSKLLKIKNKKISRIVKFECEDIVINEINKRTIYVEGVPPDTTHDVIRRIFERSGVVKHVSIPKSNGHKRSFAFVTYNTSQEAEAAIKEFHNKVPGEFLNWKGKHEIRSLVVISKEDWVSKKAEFKDLKKQLQMENKDLFVGCIANTNETVSTLTSGTLVRISGVPDNMLDKYAIRTWVSHCSEPAFVDLNKGKKECVIRFSFPVQAETFIKKLENSEFNKYKVTGVIVTGDEEEEYFRKVEELKNKLKDKKKPKI